MSVPDGPAEALDVLRLREQGGNDAHASSIEVGLGARAGLDHSLRPNARQRQDPPGRECDSEGRISDGLRAGAADERRSDTALSFILSSAHPLLRVYSSLTWSSSRRGTEWQLRHRAS